MRYAAIIPALVNLLFLLRAFSLRLQYQFDLDYMESGQLYHAWRLMHGETLFGPTTQGFIAFAYPPLHAFVLSLIGRAGLLDFWSARLLSILLFAVAAGVLARVMWKAFPDRVSRICWTSLGLATIFIGYSYCATWYDVTKMDTMTMALVIGAAACVDSDRPSLVQRLLTALCCTLALLCKQTAIFYVIWILLFHVLLHKHRAGITVALSIGLFFMVCLALEIYTEHHYLGWVYGVMAVHEVFPSKLLFGLGIYFLFAPYSPLIPFTLLVMARRGTLARSALLWAGMAGSSLPASLLPLIKDGGYVNNLMQGTLLFGPAMIVLIGNWLHHQEFQEVTFNSLMKPISSSSSSTDATRVLPTGVSANHESKGRPPILLQDRLLAAATLLLIATTRNVDQHVPTRALIDEALQMNREIAMLSGQVFIPSHPWTAIRTGHPSPQIHVIGHQDARRAHVSGVSVGDYLEQIKPDWIVLSGCEEPWIRNEIEALYRFDHSILHPVPTLVGGKCALRIVLRPR